MTDFARPNFEAAAGLHTVIWDARALEPEQWNRLHELHALAIAQLMPDDSQTAVKIAGDPVHYRDTRVDPNMLRGHGFREHQLYTAPHAAVTYDQNNQPIGIVVTVNNSSASRRLPDPLKPAEYWAKMLTPPGLPLPLVGGKRYVHLREADADAQWRPDTMANLADPEIAIALTLTGLHHTLMARHPRQALSVHLVSDHPADTTMTSVVGLLKMQEKDRSPNRLPNFAGSEVVSYELPVAQVMQNIEDMPGARDAFAASKIERITVRSALQKALAERRKIDALLRKRRQH